MNTSAYHCKLKNLKLPNYKYISIFTDKNRRIDEEFIKNNLGNLKELNYYIIGNKSFITSISRILSESGVDEENIKTDNFG